MISRTLRPLRVSTSILLPLAQRSAVPLGVRGLATAAAQSGAAPVPATDATPASQEGSAKPPRTLPYFVARNQLNNLAVYQTTSAGTKKLTLLKKGEGNLAALKQDVTTALGLPEGAVTVNSVTRHIRIKVRHATVPGWSGDTTTAEAGTPLTQRRATVGTTLPSFSRIWGFERLVMV